ncbi:LacI family DNA-binding transcriptional regulator [Streptomyces bacillaris]|uniref:LacI family DNA-binding transcriptional regulator n=1 Tax=Streptomyces bacillaris TaxID=68179 RepID=UPI000DD9794B
MVTLADVAQHAGVSASTVSYVLSGKRTISEVTKRRVERSITELGYHPNAGARALASSRSNIIALMMPLRTDMYVPVMMEIAIAVATHAREYGFDVLMLTGEEGPAAVRRVVASGLVDAVILMDVELDDARLPVLRESGRPAVLIGLPSQTTGFTCVDLDFTEAGALCVEHLAELGHREVVVIGEAPAVYERKAGFAERTIDGLRARARRLGLRVLHRPCEGTYASVASAVGQIFTERPDVTGFVVHNEQAVEPLLSLLRQERRAVPEDISVVAVCPEQVALQGSVRLTSVTIPAREMARQAVDHLIAKVEGKADDEVVLLKPELVVRASSGPAPVAG